MPGPSRLCTGNVISIYVWILPDVDWLTASISRLDGFLDGVLAFLASSSVHAETESRHQAPTGELDGAVDVEWSHGWRCLTRLTLGRKPELGRVYASS